MFVDLCVCVCVCVCLRGGWFSSCLSSCPCGGLVTSNRTMCPAVSGRRTERLEWGQSHPSFPACLVASLEQNELPLFYPLHLNWTLRWAFRSDNNTLFFHVRYFSTKTFQHHSQKACNLFRNCSISQYHLSINMFMLYWKPSFRLPRREVHQTTN